MKDEYSSHQIETFVKTLVIGGILGSAITLFVQMFT